MPHPILEVARLCALELGRDLALTARLDSGRDLTDLGRGAAAAGGGFFFMLPVSSSSVVGSSAGGVLVDSTCVY